MHPKAASRRRFDPRRGNLQGPSLATIHICLYILSLLHLLNYIMSHIIRAQLRKRAATGAPPIGRAQSSANLTIWSIICLDGKFWDLIIRLLFKHIG